jgi:hypothetical protein
VNSFACRHLFETRRHAFGAAHPDVVEQGTVADRTRVRLVAHLREIPPVIEVRVERQWLEMRRDGEGIAGGFRNELADLRAQRHVHVRLYGQHLLALDELHQFRDRIMLREPQ